MSERKIRRVVVVKDLPGCEAGTSLLRSWTTASWMTPNLVEYAVWFMQTHPDWFQIEYEDAPEEVAGKEIRCAIYEQDRALRYKCAQGRAGFRYCQHRHIRQDG